MHWKRELLYACILAIVATVLLRLKSQGSVPQGGFPALLGAICVFFIIFFLIRMIIALGGRTWKTACLISAIVVALPTYIIGGVLAFGPYATTGNPILIFLGVFAGLWLFCLVILLLRGF
jgi:hypothetical protein